MWVFFEDAVAAAEDFAFFTGVDILLLASVFVEDGTSTFFARLEALLLLLEAEEEGCALAVWDFDNSGRFSFVSDLFSAADILATLFETEFLRFNFFFTSDINGTSAESSVFTGMLLAGGMLDFGDVMRTMVTSPSSKTFAFFDDRGGGSSLSLAAAFDGVFRLRAFFTAERVKPVTREADTTPFIGVFAGVLGKFVPEAFVRSIGSVDAMLGKLANATESNFVG